jgi:hypothetical protein
VRYNFHEQLAAIKKNPRHILPADINAPVLQFLEKIGCAIGCEELKKFQNKVDYGTIELIRTDIPNAKISIQTDAGMAEGWKEYEVKRDDKWTAIVYKTVKNSNLDKKKPEKKEAK